MLEQRGYSKFIRPLLYIIDLFVLVITSYFVLSKVHLHLVIFVFFWILLTVVFSFYGIYRYTKVVKIVSLLTEQILVFTLLVFSFFFIINYNISYSKVLIFASLLLFLFTVWRIFLYFFFKKYRVITGRNYKEVVIIGHNKSTKKLADFFTTEPAYGYNYIGFFSSKNVTSSIGNFEDFFEYCKTNKIDEVYCSIRELSDFQMNKLVHFAENNLIGIKFIPDDKYIFSKRLKFEIYNYIPILTLSQIPLKSDLNKIIKRVFDILFSAFVIVFLLSWLIPILGLLIKLESKGPIFFKQNRYGLDFKLFGCYKFRSMAENKQSDKLQVSKNDRRITRIGKIIRKTSIDELPQFYNVLLGNMSVVGPRPLMLSHTYDYKNKINKFMVRHKVKPGITGLAQVRGYRGEIETKEDIINRIKYDVFYVENWSILLDLNIIIQTVINIIKGEDKAY